MKGHVGWLAVLLVAVLTACTGDQGLIDVGDGRQLYLACEGQGGPTVVLEAGGAGHSGSWRFVQPEVAKFTRVCVYDRAPAPAVVVWCLLTLLSRP